MRCFGLRQTVQVSFEKGDSIVNSFKILRGSSVCVLLAAIGCGGGSSSETGYVSGTVTLDGKPVAAGITVSAQNIDSGAPATGTTEEGGTYRLYMKGSTKINAGQYKVLVQSGGVHMEHTEAMKLLQQKKLPKVDTNAVPKKYQNYDTSKLELTVEPGNNEFDIPMKP